jgi:hypothetical protein
MELMDLTDVYGVLHLVIVQYKFLPAAHGIVPKIHHILGHKENLNKYTKIEKTCEYCLTTMQ